MTRLAEKDIVHISDSLKEYDQKFMHITGANMAVTGARMAGLTDAQAYEKRKTAVITVTSGLGEIGGFAKSIRDILCGYGVPAFVTENTDVAGILEAYEQGAEMIFMADDDAYIAFEPKGGIYAENGNCTGRAFAQALVQAADSIFQKEVLILGAGPVGSAAAKYLDAQGAYTIIYDMDQEKAERAVRGLNYAKMLSIPPIYANYRYIIEATTEADLITSRDVTEHTIISAPGVPCGVSQDACQIAKVIHNTLELGTLGMYYECIGQEKKDDE